MVSKLMSLNLGELPKTVPQFLRNNWKAATAVGACFVVVLPTLIYIYQRWTTPALSGSSASSSSKSAPVNTGFHRSQSPAPVNTDFQRSQSPAPVNPSAPHSLSSLLPRPSVKGDVDAIKLGFSVDILNRTVAIKNIIPDPDRPTLTFVFSDVCNVILDAIRHSNQKGPIIFNKVDSGHILDYLNFGLPEGESYHTTAPDNQKLSWVYQTLQALVTGRYISSFEISGNNNRTEIRIVV
jgi:hypothetical protein